MAAVDEVPKPLYEHPASAAQINGANGYAHGDSPRADMIPANDHDAELPSDVLGRRETADLVRAYYAIPESKRRQLLELAKAMGDAG